MCIPCRLLLRVHIIVYVTAHPFETSIGVYLILLVGELKVVHKIHILNYRHLLRCRGHSSVVIVVEILGQREIPVAEKPEVAGIGHPCPVRCLVVQQQAERLLLVAYTVEPLYCKVGGYVGGIALAAHCVAIVYECGVIVVALPYQYIPVVEAGRFGNKMPFANDGCLVAALLQQFGECLLRTVETAGIVSESVSVAVLACKHAGTARAA